MSKYNTSLNRAGACVSQLSPSLSVVTRGSSSVELPHFPQASSSVEKKVHGPRWKQPCRPLDSRSQPPAPNEALTTAENVIHQVSGHEIGGLHLGLHPSMILVLDEMASRHVV